MQRPLPPSALPLFLLLASIPVLAAEAQEPGPRALDEVAPAAADLRRWYEEWNRLEAFWGESGEVDYTTLLRATGVEAPLTHARMVANGLVLPSTQGLASCKDPPREIASSPNLSRILSTVRSS